MNATLQLLSLTLEVILHTNQFIKIECCRPVSWLIVHCC